MSLRLIVLIFVFIYISHIPTPISAQTLLSVPQELPQVTDSAGNAYIIVEADTYTPKFYQGRTEPTAGNPIHLTVVANTATEPAKYAWHVGSTNQTTNTPQLTINTPDSTQLLVEVKVWGEKSELLASATEYITVSQPEVIFYENNLLRGRSSLALRKEYTMIGDSASLHAEPYFIGGLENSRITWSINNRPVANNPATPLDIDLNKTDSSEPFTLEFVLQNTVRFLERVSGNLTVNFGL